MGSVQKVKPIRLNKYSGRNTFSDITNLGKQEFRSIQNFDIYSGMDGDYLRVRRGSDLLLPEDPEVIELAIVSKVVFPAPNGIEYAIFNTSDDSSPYSQFWAQALDPVANPYLIGSPFFEITGDAATYLSNLIIEGWDGQGDLTIEIEEVSTDVASVVIYLDAVEVASKGDIDTSSQPVIGAILAEVGGSGISATIDIDAWTDQDADGVISLEEFSAGNMNGKPCDMVVYNDRVYVFSQNGNKIIYWDADLGLLVGRPMGLEAPTLDSYGFETGSMLPTSTYYYGIEKVTQKNGADYVASSPNRVWSNGAIQLVGPGLDTSGGSSGMDLTIGSVGTTPVLEDDPFWTHLRLWRSKNVTPDFTDPLLPLDAQGSMDQLYEVALITRAEMFGAFGPVDTGPPLPPGNAGVSAGVISGVYNITDGNDDSVLITIIGLDLIGLIPLPGCRTGTVNKGRIWASGIGDAFVAPTGTIDPVIREDWLYTTEQNSQYQEQWDPQAYLDAGRDGKETSSLQTFMEDVIGFRQDKTKRVASGNPDSLVQMLDDKVGVPSFRMTGYITGIGICAICSDGYFRYLGFDEQWHQYMGKIEISQSIYDLTAAVLSIQRADFVYMNGKLLMLLPSGGVSALHVKEGKGWTVYAYGEEFNVAFNFASGQRAALAGSGCYLFEIETDSITDPDAQDVDADATEVTGSFEGAAFSGEGGILEVKSYSFWGKLGAIPSITAKSSNQTWQLRSGFIQPGLFAATTNLNEREYIFEPSPQTVTPYQWVPLRGQFVSFLVSVAAPSMISWQQVMAVIRPTKGNLGVYPDGGIILQGPGWNNPSLDLLNFEDPAETFYDASGKGRDHEWVANGGTKTNRSTQKPGKGLSSLSTGLVYWDTDYITALLGVNNLALRFVISNPSDAYRESFVLGSNAVAIEIYGSSTPSSISIKVASTITRYSWVNGLTAVGPVVFFFTVSKALVVKLYAGGINTSTFVEIALTSSVGTTVPLFVSPQGAGATYLSQGVLVGWNGSTLYGRLSLDSGNNYFISLYSDSGRTALIARGSGSVPTPDTVTLTQQNSSGYSGTILSSLDTVVGLPIDFTIIPLTGHTIQPKAIISYHETIQSDPGLQQAKRFWGMMKAF